MTLQTGMACCEETKTESSNHCLFTSSWISAGHVSQEHCRQTAIRSQLRHMLISLHRKLFDNLTILQTIVKLITETGCEKKKGRRNMKMLPLVKVPFFLQPSFHFSRQESPLKISAEKNGIIVSLLVPTLSHKKVH